jgi:hypothetical protein
LKIKTDKIEVNKPTKMVKAGKQAKKVLLISLLLFAYQQQVMTHCTPNCEEACLGALAGAGFGY